MLTASSSAAEASDLRLLRCLRALAAVLARAPWICESTPQIWSLDSFQHTSALPEAKAEITAVLDSLSAPDSHMLPGLGISCSLVLVLGVFDFGGWSWVGELHLNRVLQLAGQSALWNGASMRV